MRRLLLLPVLFVLTLAAACSAGGGPSWTLGPSPATDPPASPSASAGASGSAVPSGSAQPSPSAQPSGSPGGEAVQVSAAALQFEQSTLAAPADTAFTIHFDNKDPGQLHNVEIKDPSGASKFRGEVITGPAVIDYSVPALPAGDYTFVCTVHVSMTGTLTAS